VDDWGEGEGAVRSDTLSLQYAGVINGGIGRAVPELEVDDG